MKLPRAPLFWGKSPSLLAYALSPLAAIYGIFAAARLRRPAPVASLPTIVIGGLTLGGDGKTPTALAIGRLLLRMGERPAFVTRGYGRAWTSDLPMRVDPVVHGATDVGDEALMLAEVALTIVGANRVESGKLAAQLGATALILDDGLHSRKLEPDFAILVVDRHYGAGSGYCPPAGPLRALLGSQYAQADAVLLIECPGYPDASNVELTMNAAAEIWRAQIVSDPVAAKRLLGERVLAFAGLGRPEKFERTLNHVGALVVARRWFSDHHHYLSAELESLAREARMLGAQLVTTEKDAARIGHKIDAQIFLISLNFSDEAKIESRLSEVLSSAREKRRVTKI